MNEFKLFISGDAASYRGMISGLESFLTEVFSKDYTLSIIDVIKNPLEVQQEGILATPTLVKVNLPRKKVLGDFTDIGKVFNKLGISCLPNTTDLTHNE